MAEETYTISGKEADIIQFPTIDELGWKKQGYIFRGWGNTKDSKTIVVGDGGSKQFYNNADLYAIWNSTDYLCFTALHDNTQIWMTCNRITNWHLVKQLVYSIDNKNTLEQLWPNSNANISNKIILEKAGQLIYIKTLRKSDGYNTLIVRK